MALLPHGGGDSIRVLWPGFPETPAPPVFRLARAFSPPDAEPHHLAAILRACPHLEDLELFDRLSESALEAVVAAGPDSLRTISIDQDQEVMNMAERPLPHTVLAALLSRFRDLRELNICGGLDDRSLEHMHAEVGKALALERLRLTGNRFTSNGIASLAQCPLNSLHTLVLVPRADSSLNLRALQQLAASPQLGSLRVLSGFHGLGMEARAIVEASPVLHTDLEIDF